MKEPTALLRLKVFGCPNTFIDSILCGGNVDELLSPPQETSSSPLIIGSV